VQSGQLTNQTAQQALAELTQRTQASQFTQSLDAQKAQTGIANTLGLAGLMNTPGGNLFNGSTNDQNKATFLDIYKKLGITPPTETPVVTPPVVTPGGGGGGGTTGGTGGIGGTEGQGVGPNGQQIIPIAPDLGQQAYNTMIPAFDQAPVASRQLTPAMLADMQKTQQPVNPYSSQSAALNLQPVGLAQPQTPDVTGQMGLTPDQLAQLQRMLGIGDAQMASTDF
jgi:hypothetical protein